MKGFWKNNKGFSLVEMLCAVAILSLVSGIIGTIVVVSARTYQKGVSETSIQQEAQQAANNISNLIKDACQVEYADDTLKIMTNEAIEYWIEYSAAQKKLLYIEVANSTATTAQILAEKVSFFSADTSDFEDTRTIQVTMEIEDETTNRTIPLEYTMKSRNDTATEMEFASVSDEPVIIFLETNVIMVPGETYQIPLYVSGKLNEGLEATGTNCSASATLDYAEVTVPTDTTETEVSLTVSTKDKKSDGTPKATANATVRIRRVKTVSVTKSVDRTGAEDGTYEGAGAVYTFLANVSGDNLPQSIGSSFDSGYKTAQAVYWSYTLTAGGSTYTWTCDVDGEHYSNQNGAEKYIKVKNYKADISRPTLDIEIVQTMTSDFSLTVTASSKHALGVNKAGVAYGTVSGNITVTPRETKITGTYELTLEPLWSGSVPINMLGGLSDDITFDYDTDTPRSDSSTEAKYDADTGEVTVTLGPNEQGSGDTYTFTIDVLVDKAKKTTITEAKKTTITVHVSRIDEVSLAVIHNYHLTDTGTPTYDFRLRYNTSDAELANMNADYLIKDTQAVPNTLATRITWEVIDHSGAEEVVKHTESVVCYAGVGANDTGRIVGSYQKKYDGYYSVVKIKPARIEQDSSGNWYLKQLPEIDMNAETTLPKNYELRVTMEALHPYNSNGTPTNKYGEAYTDSAVTASASLWGEQTMSIPTDYVIAEPGQGTNDADMSDEELVIPITVKGGAVYSMSATISGNSDSSTKPSDYSSDEKDNPFEGVKATSSTDGVWYLGLVIGKNEKGQDGKFTVSVEANNSNGDAIASMDITVVLRRVNEVEVKAASTSDSQLTLEAYPTGYGENGTQYYAIQQDANGKTCRWESTNHGEYKSPYSMRWTMIYNGTEKALDKWTEYISSATTAIDADNGKATVAITLKSGATLPTGAVIRAYSLHAQGNETGSDTYTSGDTKYNKSGKKYAEVYGEYTIGGSSNVIVNSTGFQRAADFTFVNGIANVRSYVTDISYHSQQRCFMRYRIKGTKTWSQYYRMDSASETQAFMSGNWNALLFLPENEYELEIINVVYNPQDKLIYWPQDKTLLESGTGFGELGFTIWDGSGSYYQKEQVYSNLKAVNEEYRWTFTIPKVTLGMETGDYWEVAGGMTLADMSQSNPVCLKAGDKLAVEISPTTMNLHNTQYNFTAVIDKKNADGSWTELTAALDNSEDGWFLQTRCPQYQIYNVYSQATGEYRIRAYIDDMTWKELGSVLTINGTEILTPTQDDYKDITRDMNLYDEGTGEGILYIKFTN